MIKLLWKDDPTAFSPMGGLSAHTRKKKAPILQPGPLPAPPNASGIPGPSPRILKKMHPGYVLTPCTQRNYD